MSRPEDTFRASCSKKYRDLGAEVQSIESPDTGLGIPDNYLAHKGSYAYPLLAWIEYKFEPDGAWPCDRKIAFRPGQYAWLKRNAKQGGPSFVCIKYKNGVLLQHIYMVDAETNRPDKSSGLFMKKFDAKLALDWMHTFVCS